MNPVQRRTRILKIFDVSSMASLLSTPNDSNSMFHEDNTRVIPILLFLLATGTVLRKAAIDRGVRLATGRYGCRYRGVLT